MKKVKIMKRVISLLLSLIIVLSFGVVVAAEDINKKIGDLSVAIPECLPEYEETENQILYGDKEARRSVGYVYIKDGFAQQEAENMYIYISRGPRHVLYCIIPEIPSRQF